MTLKLFFWSAPQDFYPRIHITNSDFASITENGALCDADGHLGQTEFANVIRRQVVEPQRFDVGCERAEHLS